MACEAKQNNSYLGSGSRSIKDLLPRQETSSIPISLIQKVVAEHFNKPALMKEN